MTPRYQTLRQGRVLRVVDTEGCSDPIEGTAICFVGGDAEHDQVAARAQLVADALNAYDESFLRAGSQS